MWKMAIAALIAVLAGAAAAVWVAGKWQPRDEAAVPEWTTLPNGLRFRVQRIEGAKDVAVATVFGVGSDADPPGQSGLAHLAEHVLVTSAAGTSEARSAEQWADRYRRRCSATTHPEYTCMAGAVSPGHLADELRDAAARMSDLRIEPSDLDRERPRVLEQIAERDTDVSGRIEARRLAMERILPGPNAAHRGGTKADVERLSLDDLRTFARRFYRPANARIAVAGDVDPAEVEALCTKLFGDLPAGDGAPALPQRDPVFGEVRVDAEEKPGPAYESSHGVCIAYPNSISTLHERAAATAFTFWNTSEDASEERISVSPDERSVHALSPMSDPSAEDMVKSFEALVADFEQHAAGPAAAARVRDAIHRMARTAESLRKAGIDWEPPRIDDEVVAPLPVAVHLAVDSVEFSDWRSLLAAVGRLTNDDMRGWVAKWHVAERRVVVDWNGWRKTVTDDEPTPPAPERLPKREFIGEVRVTLTWDEATQTVHRKIGDREFADDAELEKAIKAAHAEWVEKGKPDVPVTISADNRASWSHVVEVMNVIKRCGIEKIEFATPEPPKQDAPK